MSQKDNKLKFPSAIDSFDKQRKQVKIWGIIIGLVIIVLCIDIRYLLDNFWNAHQLRLLFPLLLDGIVIIFIIFTLTYFLVRKKVPKWTKICWFFTILIGFIYYLAGSNLNFLNIFLVKHKLTDVIKFTSFIGGYTGFIFLMLRYINQQETLLDSKITHATQNLASEQEAVSLLGINALKELLFNSRTPKENKQYIMNIFTSALKAWPADIMMNYHDKNQKPSSQDLEKMRQHLKDNEVFDSFSLFDKVSQEVFKNKNFMEKVNRYGLKIDLQSSDLRAANLTRANLTGARLTRADLTGANLKRAELFFANLTEARLTRADLTGALLDGADLTGADLEGADLTRVRLSGADLTRVRSQGASLQGADLPFAHLEGGHLIEANLREADLERADLEGADLTGADLTGADLEGANLKRARLSGADLTRAELFFANLTGADLEGANLRNAGLFNTNLTGALLDGADLRVNCLDWLDLSHTGLIHDILKAADSYYNAIISTKQDEYLKKKLTKEEYQKMIVGSEVLIVYEEKYKGILREKTRKAVLE